MSDEKDGMQYIADGKPDERLNGLTVEQFRAHITALEAHVVATFQNNGGMIATAYAELVTRMVLDHDEQSQAVGDEMLARFIKCLHGTVAEWRKSVAVSKAEFAAANRSKMN